MKRFLVAASFAVLTCSAFALPTIGQVQSEIGIGHYARAEEMTREVVAAKPDSARARYVHAEILAHNQRFALAAEEAAQAQKLDPSLSFTDPEKFRTFTQLLARQQSPGIASSAVSSSASALKPAQFAAAAPVTHGGAMPAWAWGGVIGLLAMLAWRALGARQPVRTQWPPAIAASADAQPTGMPGTAGAAGFGGYAPAPSPAAASSTGGGLWRTGMAVAGGVAAGMLAEKLLEGQRESGAGAGLLPANRAEPISFDDRSAHNAAADELERRSIDMGNGADWGGADSDSNISGDDGW